MPATLLAIARWRQRVPVSRRRMGNEHTQSKCSCFCASFPKYIALSLSFVCRSMHARAARIAPFSRLHHQSIIRAEFPACSAIAVRNQGNAKTPPCLSGAHAARIRPRSLVTLRRTHEPSECAIAQRHLNPPLRRRKRHPRDTRPATAQQRRLETRLRLPRDRRAPAARADHRRGQRRSRKGHCAPDSSCQRTRASSDAMRRAGDHDATHRLRFSPKMRSFLPQVSRAPTAKSIFGGDTCPL